MQLKTPYVPLFNNNTGNSLDAEYQNTSARFRIVTVSISVTITVAGGQGIVFGSSKVTSPVGSVGAKYVGIAAGVLNEHKYFTLTFYVPPGYYYKVDSITLSSNATVTIQGFWQEIDI